jgi:hypothetical protein
LSRSYKHTPIDKGGGFGSKYAKRCANKRVRRYKHLSNGCRYKLCYDSINIYDFRILNFDWKPDRKYLKWMK